MQSEVSPQFPFSLIFRRLFISLLIGLLVISPVVISLTTPSISVYAQDDSTPTPVPHLQRLDYFRPTLREPFQNDIRFHLDAPLYTGNINLILRDESAIILGDLAIEYTNQSGDNLDEIVFRLYPNLPTYGGQLTVTYVQVDLQPIEVVLDESETVLTVALPGALAPQQSMRIQLQFQSIVPTSEHLYNQYIYIHDTLALANFFPLLSVYDEDTQTWWENTNHPWGDAVFSETSFFDFNITAPANWTLITTGINIATRLNADQTRTTRYLASLVRDFVIMGSPDYHTLSGSQAGVGIDVHYLSGGEMAAQQSLQYAMDAVQLYSAIFGQYPYTELDIVETHTTAGGIEYPGLIVVTNQTWNAVDSYLEIVTVHEVAHQWWYGLVGNDQTRYPWLDESLTQYSLGLYYGYVYGIEAQINTFAGYERTWRDSEDIPIGFAPSSYEGDSYWTIIYNKGPLFFTHLAAEFGQENLLSALSSYFRAFKYDVATPADLKLSLEINLDASLDEYFAEWVEE